ncbi:uncharacterized protein B0I36DRAFT_369425 [Microdochium trichocladiopsis]|uniref:Uncharacterized protein n=1 Tax=Microdochium trichocladiopsis TaxID=1682393 RepID=A0A9P8XSL8_9PEZI|nr:uncharacterized protein B0I36DRAFT_369425 [Microdochium trichocladiopsis]KAH7014470.1 hypothetical protein B0I36DRAFT_369425 [Microdochium trichocladiopsis]
MKSIASLSFVAGLTVVSALPTSEGASGSITDALTWTGQVQLGQLPIVLTGTAEEIYHNITAINPNYDSELGINSQNSLTTEQNLENLALLNARAPTSSDYTCNYGTWVSALNTAAVIRYLYSIGNGDCAAPPGRPGAGGCSNTGCAGESSVWLCNDYNFQLHVPCRLVADNAVEVMIKCQNNDVVRGQIFSTDRGWNTIVNRC